MDKSPLFAEYFNNLSLSIQRGLPKRAWDWQAVILTILLVQLAATRLAMSEWVPFLRIVIILSFYAVSLGLIVGYSSLTRRNAIWVGIEYGLVLIPMQLLKTIEPTGLLYMDLRGILIRLFNSLVFLTQNQPVYDTSFFLTLASLGFWTIGVHAGYQLTRHGNFLKIALPSGLAMLIIQIYDPWVSLRAWSLAIFIFFALALLGRFNFLDNKNGWKTKRVFRTSDSEWDFSRSAITFAAIAVFVAWALPGALSSIKPAAQAWNDFTDPIAERLSNTVSALDSPYGASSGGDFYSSSLSLGDNAPVSDTIVFYVEADQVKFEPVRYYWRGRVYDQYINGQWSNTNVTHQNFDPEVDELQTVDPLRRNEAIFTVTMNFPRQELIYAPSGTVWVDRESRLAIASPKDSVPEVTAWLANPGLVAGETYKVRAMITNPSIEELRAAGTSYPNWVTDRYLQIPKEIEPQIRTLTDRIAGSYITPYDKAQAITAYLRTEIKYTPRLKETPPSFEDPLLWVLLEYKNGFCMYSASAEVLMLRSLGIPARMAVGFTQGEFEAKKNRYTVAQLNSHAWPEVYFPEIGWVEFEPTGNQAPLNRPQQPTDEDLASKDQDDSGNTNTESNIEDTLNPRNDPTLFEVDNLPTPTQIDPATRFLYSALLLGLVTLCVFLIQRYSLADRLPVYLESRYIKNGRQPPTWLKRWTKWAMLTSIERSFHTIDLSLRWLRHPQPAHTTPLERANMLGKLLPSARDAISILRQEHETSLFTKRPGNITIARKAALIIMLKTGQIRLKEALQFLDYRYNRLR